MKIIIAPDKFKGTLSADAVARALAEGIRTALPDAEIICAPMADGGEGTTEAMVAAAGGEFRTASVTGPLGDPVIATFGVLGDGSAVLEMAQASGLALLPEAARNPLKTTTYGTGELIKAVLDLGCLEVIVGIGGSATVDAGLGCAQALGVLALAADGSPVGFGGAELIRVEKLDASRLDPRVKESRILVASDVENPLFGAQGAARVFAPQKGASDEDVALLERGLRHIAGVIERDLGIDVSRLKGGGAAGGLGAGLVAFLGASIEPGARLVMDAIGLRERAQTASLIVTGEGQIDEQSAYGKVPSAVAELARDLSVPVVAVAGRLGKGAERLRALGVRRFYSLTDIAGSVEAAMAEPAAYLRRVGALIAHDIL